MNLNYRNRVPTNFQVLNIFDYKQFCGMAAMAERLYCADFSRTGQDKYTQQESKVLPLFHNFVRTPMRSK